VFLRGRAADVKVKVEVDIDQMDCFDS
jgi:hypothetical protein